ncbi:CHE group protein [Cavenderia fasciculata]|uniref:CHE group protein n=1 Tax=Cavenderia fasciculata TaxID=261658 RepID=F4Q8U9_CACFS|nr:CHE group protein [Cavenderia fasciculata]EGG15118.1 CHE group protein [Cavenderia fasciculata]|eukprot:XP_004351838.1 CHE group protein [Cavenderia fasciculata]
MQIEGDEDHNMGEEEDEDVNIDHHNDDNNHTTHNNNNNNETTTTHQIDNNNNNNNNNTDNTDIAIGTSTTSTSTTSTTIRNSNYNEEDEDAEEDQIIKEDDEEEEEQQVEAAVAATEEEEEEEEEEEDEEMEEDEEDEEEEDGEEEEEEEEEEESQAADEDEDGDSSDSDKESKAEKEKQLQAQQEQEQQQQEQPVKEPYRMPEDYLVPIRLEVQNGLYRLWDQVLWNINETQVTPEQFAKGLCADLDLPDWFDPLVASAINNQLNRHRDVMERLEQVMAGIGSERIITIVLDLTVNGLHLRDQFEWDILSSTNVEAFAKSLSLDLGLSREFENSISFTMREQIQYQYELLATRALQQRPMVTAHTIMRNELDVQNWSPFVRPLYPIPHLIKRQ